VLRRALRPIREPPPFLSPTAVLILKTSLAAGLAWEVGRALGQPKPYFAVLAVVIAMQGTPYGSVIRAGQLLLGVLVGLVLGVLALQVTGLSGPTVAALILVALLLGTRIKVGADTNTQLAISALLLLAIGAVNWGLTRLWETAMGGVIAVLVSVVLWPPNPVGQVSERLRRTQRLLAEDLLKTFQLIGTEGDRRGNLSRLRSHSGDADEAVAQLTAAEQAIRWNPWRSSQRQQLARLDLQARLLAQLYRHARSAARAVADLREGDRSAQWTAAKPALVDAAQAVVEALELRLASQDQRPALDRARRAGRDVADRLRGDLSAAALAVELDHTIGDLERTYRPEPVEHEGRAAAARRLLAALGSLTHRMGERGSSEARE
jgi:uncharacterized membrane protein YgaE (UPF0421/DUF939 family)